MCVCMCMGMVLCVYVIVQLACMLLVCILLHGFQAGHGAAVSGTVHVLPCLHLVGLCLRCTLAVVS
jgi:hypothetical protein